MCRYRIDPLVGATNERTNRRTDGHMTISNIDSGLELASRTRWAAQRVPRVTGGDHHLRHPSCPSSIIIHHPSSIIHYPSSIIHHTSTIIHQPSTINHHPSYINHHPSSIIITANLWKLVSRSLADYVLKYKDKRHTCSLTPFCTDPQHTRQMQNIGVCVTSI